MRNRLSRLVSMGALLLAVPVLAAHARSDAPAFDAARADQPLPSHPDVTIGALDNGLTYMVKEHSTPPGRVYLSLHIASGSINETDKQRGLAHFLEHLAFNGSKNFAPGTLIPFFESIGLTFGRHQNASTGFEATTYLLDLPRNDKETVSKGLLFLSDVAGRLDLLQEEIEKERQIILEEKRARLSPVQRIFDETLPRLYPGARVGRRLPIGIEETILGVNRQDFADYYGRWYTTGNMTLVAVGDAPRETIIELVKVYFGDIAGKARPEPEDPGITPWKEQRAIVASDPELPYTGIEITMVRPGYERETTVGAARRSLVDSIGSFAFNRRVRAKVDAGETRFRGASASVSDLFRAARESSVQAIGEAKDWRVMLAQLGTETQRARQHGFTEREIEDARRELLNQAENAVQRESTTPSRAFAGGMVRAAAEQEPFLSAAQRFELRKALLPTITTKEVSEAFARNFDPAGATFQLTMPSPKGGDDGATPVPSESEALEAGKAAFSVTVAAEAEKSRPDRFMAETPTPGTVEEMTIHAPTEVFSAWLSNGVRLHHRFMDYRKNSATIIVTLAGGEIEETGDSRGLTEAAMLAWSRPATKRLTSENIRDLLIGKDVRAFGGPGTDTIGLSINGAPKDLETGLQLAHLMLTEPKLERAAWDQWKEATAQSIKARKTQPAGVMGELLVDTLYPKDDPRHRPLEQTELDALDLSRAQAWIERIIASAPIEVSIVGDIDRKTAVDLATKYIGSLGKRARISATTLADKRTIARPAGPIVKRAEVETLTPQAVVMVGFWGVDTKHVKDDRLMDLAAQALSTRMIKQVREEAQLVYSIRAANASEDAYPGFGLFFGRAPTEPAKAEPLAAKLASMFEEFVQSGPSADEMEVARGQILNTIDEGMKEPGFWTGVLAAIEYRGMSLDDVAGMKDAFKAYTRDETLEAYRRYWKPESMMTLIVTPRAPPPAGAPPAPEAGAAR